jgi:hypothetical protein
MSSDPTSRKDVTEPVAVSSQLQETSDPEGEMTQGGSLRNGDGRVGDGGQPPARGLMRKRRLAIPRGGGGTVNWVHVEDAALRRAALTPFL